MPERGADAPVLDRKNKFSLQIPLQIWLFLPYWLFLSSLELMKTAQGHIEFRMWDVNNCNVIKKAEQKMNI